MAGWPPEKNAAFTWYFVIRDADGDLVAGATGLDVESSGDGAAFADVAGTETDEGEGLYSCIIASGEMNFDAVGLICKTSTSGAKTAAQVIYTSTRQIDDLCFPTTSGRSFDISATGEGSANLTQINGAAQTATLDDIEAQTDDIGVAGAGLTAIPWNSAWDTEVESECNDALVALNLDHLMAVAVVGTDVVDNSVFAKIASSAATADWDTFVNTDDSLQAISEGGGGGPTAAVIADAVWDEAQADHVAAGSFGEMATEIAAILIDTAEIGAAGAGLSAIPWNAAWDTEVESEVTDALVAFFTSSAQLVDDIWDEILTGATHNVVDSAARRLRDLQEFGIYEGGAIWIDTVNGAAGTTDYESGTVFNPVDTIADANILAASLGLSRFRVAPGSTITFAAAQQAQEFLGSGWTLALGGRDIANSLFVGATVSGIGTGVGMQSFLHCEMGAVTLPADTHLDECGISGTQTFLAGDYFYDRCHSDVAGSGAPQFDFTVGALNTNLGIRNYSGGVDLRNMGQAGTDVASIEGRGQVIVNVNCTGGTIVIRGAFELSDSGAATITDGARWNQSQILSDATPFAGADIASILTDTGEIGAAGAGLSAIPWNSAWDTEVESECNDALVALNLDHLLAVAVAGTDVTDDSVVAFLVSKEATADWDDFVNTTDSLQALSDRLPAALVSGLMSSDVTAISTSTAAADRLEISVLAMVEGTVDTTGFAPTTVEFEADDITEATADHFIGRIVIFTLNALNQQATDITDYALATGRGHFTVTAMTEAPANNDTFIII